MTEFNRSHNPPNSFLAEYEELQEHMAHSKKSKQGVSASGLVPALGTASQQPQPRPAIPLVDYRHTGMLQRPPRPLSQHYVYPGYSSVPLSPLTSSFPSAVPSASGLNTSRDSLYQTSETGNAATENTSETPPNASSLNAPNTLPMLPEVGEFDYLATALEGSNNSSSSGIVNGIQNISEAPGVATHQLNAAPSNIRANGPINFDDAHVFDAFDQEKGIGLGDLNVSSLRSLTDTNGESVLGSINLDVSDGTNPRKRRLEEEDETESFENAEGSREIGTPSPNGIRPSKRSRGMEKPALPQNDATNQNAQINMVPQVKAQSRPRRLDGAILQQTKVDELHYKRKNEEAMKRHHGNIRTSVLKTNDRSQAPFLQSHQQSQKRLLWPADPFENSTSQRAASGHSSRRVEEKRDEANPEDHGQSRQRQKRSHQGQLKGSAYDTTDRVAMPVTTQGLHNTQNSRQALARDTPVESEDLHDHRIVVRQAEPTPRSAIDTVGEANDEDQVDRSERWRRLAPTKNIKDLESSLQPVTNPVQGEEDNKDDDVDSLFEESHRKEADKEEEEDHAVRAKRQRTNALTEDAAPHAPIVQRAANLAPSTTNLNRKASGCPSSKNLLPRSMPRPTIPSLPAAAQMAPTILAPAPILATETAAPQLVSSGMIVQPTVPPHMAAAIAPPPMPLEMSLQYGGKHPPSRHSYRPPRSAEEEPPQEWMDYRTIEPRNLAERESLREALKLTQIAYYEWTGTEGPSPDWSQSYNDQFELISGSFEFAWSMCSQKRFDKQPTLFKLPAWSGSVDKWPKPVKDKRYFGPFKYGFWAPIREDGKLVDLPGELLEEASRQGPEKRVDFLHTVAKGLKYLAPNVWNYHFG